MDLALAAFKKAIVDFGNECKAHPEWAVDLYNQVHGEIELHFNPEYTTQVQKAVDRCFGQAPTAT